MDAFQVPKKVNRHVLKAIKLLTNDNINGSATTSEILNQVKYQMRNLVPVTNIDMVIQKSLKNLSDIGLINRAGIKSFSIGHPPNSNRPKTNPNLFKPSGSRKRSADNLDPNARKIQYASEDSLSGDDYDRSRKRLRTNNKKIMHTGRSTELPKAKQHYYKSFAKKRSFRKTNYNTDNPEKITEVFSENVFNDDSYLTNISASQPLVITEILYSNVNSAHTQQPSVIELYNKSKSFHSDGITSATNSIELPTEKYSVHSNSYMEEHSEPSLEKQPRNKTSVHSDSYREPSPEQQPTNKVSVHSNP